LWADHLLRFCHHPSLCWRQGHLVRISLFARCLRLYNHFLYITVWSRVDALLGCARVGVFGKATRLNTRDWLLEGKRNKDFMTSSLVSVE
jgi:hypothetical protein